MKHATWILLFLVPVTIGLVVVAHFSTDASRATAAPPLVLTPELLKEGLPEASKQVELDVDNSACYVCHGNYVEDKLAIVHGKESVGCIDCHGESHAHRDDEDNITPPDKMYAPDQIDSMCGKCHDMHDAAAHKVIKRWQDRCPTKTDPKEIVCTDCHFQHRLAFRTNWWDKKTGKFFTREQSDQTKPSENSAQDDKGEKKP